MSPKKKKTIKRHTTPSLGLNPSGRDVICNEAYVSASVVSEKLKVNVLLNE
jgi:hypothetical protein